MPQLFKDRIIQEKLANFEIPDMEGKLAVIEKWHRAYQSKELHKKTESQCEQAFNQDFFVEILGYRAFPNETYTIDPKGFTDATGQKPDALLGYFSAEEKVVIAVAEIKDVNTTLDRSQRREGNLSPIQQAFKYKPQYKSCTFVIASNFFEIRLLKDNQLDYEQFTLASLLDPKDNHFQFRKFYFLLCERNFVSRTGKSITEGLLSEINIEQDKITKAFYKEYKELRQELIRSIVKNNQKAQDKRFFYTLAVEKAQKLIDRIVFVCFCEDIGLLPEDSLKKVIAYAESGFVEMPLWEVLKAFFEAIDKGSDRLQIPEGYNGELFKPDKDLDELIIDTEVLKSLADLGHFDFSEDLSVNILGHIFEQSIADIEKLKAMIKEEATDEIDKKKSKRKSDGIFYTPDYITDYIVKNSLGTWLREREEEILDRHKLKKELIDKNYDKRALAAFEEYQKALQGVKVLDPACGSGAFLVKVFDYLLAENQRIADILTDLRGGGKAKLFEWKQGLKEILHNNIYGVDINPESVEITKLSLWLKSAQKGKKLANLSGNIKCGNSLVDAPAIAGNRAFKWEEEFPEIMQTGGFDVIVGNPPYVRADSPGNTKEFREHLTRNSRFKTLSGKWDLYVPFVELSVKLLKPEGKSSLIIPDAFCHALYAKTTLQWLKENRFLEEIDYFPDMEIFENVGVKSVIILNSKRRNGSFNQKVFHGNINDFTSKTSGEMPEGLRHDTKDTLIKTDSGAYTPLSDICYISVGIVGNSHEKLYPNEFKLADLVNEKQDEQHPKAYVEGKGIYKWVIPQTRFIEYGTERSPKKWRRKAFPELFTGDKLLSMRIAGSIPKTAFVGHEILFNHTAIAFKLWKDLKGIKNNSLKKSYITDKRRETIENFSEGFSLKYILAILNSSLIRHELNKSRRSNTDVYPDDWKTLPIKKATPEEQQPFIAKVDEILTLLDNFYRTGNRFSEVVKSEFATQLSGKAQEFWSLEFGDFTKSLKLKNIPLSRKADLQVFFEEYKGKVLEMQQRIKKLEQEIDEMVLELYGISEADQQAVMK